MLGVLALGQGDEPGARWSVQPAQGPAREQAAELENGAWTAPLPEGGSATLLAPVSRRARAAGFRVSFALGEEDDSRLAVRWDAEDAGFELELRFSPLVGGVWRLFTLEPGERVLVAELTEIPEPPELLYELDFRLPVEGGLRVSFADGRDLLATRAGMGSEGSLTLERTGPVRDVRFSWPAAPTPEFLPGELQELAAARGPDVAAPAFRGEPGHDARSEAAVAWLLAEFPGVQERECASEMLGALQAEYHLVEWIPRAHVPVLVVRPAQLDRAAPGVLLLGGIPRSTRSRGLLSLACALAERGFVAAWVDAPGQADRRETQPHDGPWSWTAELADLDLADLCVAETRQLGAWLAARDDVDPARCGAVAAGASARVLARAAAELPSLRALVLAPEVPEDPELPASLLRTTLDPQAAAGPEVLWLTAAEAEALVADTPSGARAAQHRRVVDALAASLAAAAAAPSSGDTVLEWFDQQEPCLGGLWESWIAYVVRLRTDAVRSVDRAGGIPMRDSVSRLLGLALSAAPPLRIDTVSTTTDQHGAVLVLVSRAGRESSAVLHAPAGTFAPGTEEFRVVPPGARRAVVAVGDRGQLEALNGARAAGLEADVWIGWDPWGFGTDRHALHEAAVAALHSAAPLLGCWSEDLRELLARVRADLGGGEIVLYGEGWGAALALFAASMEPAGIARVVGHQALPSFRLLAEVTPRALTCGPPSEVLTEQPAPCWFVPGVLGTLDLEDVVLALLDAGVAVEWRDPVDARRRPLARRDRLAQWPRVRHREWND